MKLKRLYHSLRFKVTLGILLPLLVILSILSYRQYASYQELLMENLQLSASSAGEIIEGSLLYAMLTNDFSTVQQILDNIAEQQGVHGLFLLDKEGHVVLSAGSEALGGKVDIEDATCQVCHDQTDARWNGSLILANEASPRDREADIFRNANAIENKEGCQACHDPQSPITGLLIADFPMAPVRAQLALWRRRSLLWSVGSVLLVAGIIDLLMSRMVVRRLERFVRVVKRVGTGDLDARVTSENADEIGQLAHSFDRMAEGLKEKDRLEQNLQERTAELQVQAEKLSTLNTIANTVSQSLNLQEILDSALAKVLELMRLRAGWVVLRTDTGRLRDGTQDLDLVATQGLPRKVALAHVRCAGNQCVCPDVLESGESKVLQRTAEEGCATATYFAQEGLVFRSCVPLQAKERVLGVMSLAGDAPEARQLPTQDTLDTLAAIGRQIGIAVENAILYEELRKEEQLRRQLLDRLITVQEEERKRIALELHDQTGQPLTSLIMTLGMLGESESLAEVRAQARYLRETAAQVMKEVHDLALELRPSVLDDLGLLAALRHLHKDYQDRFHMPVDLEVLGLEGERLPPEVETALYRIVQEALTNVARHAQAENVSVVLEKRDRAVRLIIEDDGQGFDVNSLLGSRREAESAEGKLGLIGMRERAALLGGTLTIESTPGMGTTVFVDVPLVRRSSGEVLIDG
jgi:signal transduction histidine kinase/HAMP domain-containing protein